MKDLTKGSITKLIFWFALPVFIGSLLQMTYNLVDTKIIGYVLGESSLAAVGSTNSVNTLVIGFLQGLTNGFAVIAAQFFGAGDTANFKRTVAGSFKYGIMISAGLTVVVLIFLRPLLKVLNTPEDLLKEAYDYNICRHDNTYALQCLCSPVKVDRRFVYSTYIFRDISCT